MSRRRLLCACVVAACGGANNHPVDAPAGDAARPVDAAHTADAAPIAITPSTWTFTPVDDTSCANGTPAGLATNGAPSASTDLLVYFEGGGACWDELTCITLQSAAYFSTGYDETTFESELPTLETLPLVNRAGSDTTFAAANYAYVPYCTGDLHAGTGIATLGSGSAAQTAHFVGARNAATFAATLHASLPGVTRIWLVGSSAGGYGATFALPAFAAQWPDADIEVLQDSALFITPLADYATMVSAWQPAFPTGCASCATDLSAMMPTLTSSFATTRFGVLDFDEDAVMKTFLDVTGSLSPLIATLLGSDYALPTTHGFELVGTGHVLLFDAENLVGSNGLTAEQWVDQWGTGSAAWATVTAD
jgi:hypothetical protein